MTTEILRNISYRTLLEGDPLSSFAPNLGDVALTVLDEVHYLGHPERGSVWEEIIINCPPHMKLLAMSATVANPAEIGEWIQHVHGACETVQTTFRPVPLKWWFAWGQPNPRQGDSRVDSSDSRGSGGEGAGGEDNGDGRRHVRRAMLSSAGARVMVRCCESRTRTCVVVSCGAPSGRGRERDCAMTPHHSVVVITL
jgi:superfamily II RNA helicase